MKAFLAICLVVCSLPAWAQRIPTQEVQLKTAILAAPQDLRENATVYGYDPNGVFTLLRQGSNELICLADDPSGKGFSVSCYHRSIEPFMARGRELKNEGKSFQEIFDIRESEAKSGKLILPESGTTLYVLTAEDADVNLQTGEVKNPYVRSVVYIPWATAESTGLPLKPLAPGMPWIMDPGTHRAHIMINPAK